MIDVHHLDGCAPTPLAHYLKALGILRLVAEQADPEARGWWDGDRFCLATKLSRTELNKFLLNDYCPTPLVSPWNKGSGFFSEEDSVLLPLEQSKNHRFSDFRDGIKASRQRIEDLKQIDRKIRDIKNEAKKQNQNRLGEVRSRAGFEDDYTALVHRRDQAKEQILKSSIIGSRDEVAYKEFERAKELINEAEEYKELLGKRDEAEQNKSSELRNILNKLKISNNYKRRLKEANQKYNKLKASLIPNFRLHWRGAYREWMDATIVLGDDGTPKYPALLGTGGNDGRFDFTNNFMKCLGKVFNLSSHNGKPKPEASACWIDEALWNIPVPKNVPGQPVGQYLPGMAGGANNANGPDADSLVNPLDFIMMLEGTIAFRSSASRRFELLESSRAATPFAINACGAAYPSASADDEGARGEQWMPLWSQPSTYGELCRLLAEGRAQVTSKSVREPLDLARAVKRLGVARGIRAFQRYGYIERNGQSNLAVPLGRFDVATQTSEHMACIDDLDLWLRHLRRGARDKKAPARLRQVEKRLVDALFTVTAEHSQSPDRWQGVLSQLTDAEAIMRQGTGHEAQPIPPLRPEWVVASDDGTPEFRLALAFALQGGGRGKFGVPVDPIRRHWLPLDREKRWRFATSGNGLDMQPEVVMQGRCGLDDAIALVQRRLVEASQHEARHLPLDAMPQASASIADLTALLTGNIDLDRTLILARALMALDRKAWANRPQKPIVERPHGSDQPDDAWLAIRLCTLPWPLTTPSGFKLDIGADPALIRHLATGDAAKAFVTASRRLRAAGVRGTIRSGAAPPETARLWAAALAFPITNATAARFLFRLDPSLDPSKDQP